MATTKKTDVTYKAFTPQSQYQVAFEALLAAESLHYRLKIVNPTSDPALDDRLESAAEEVERLQKIVADAEKETPTSTGPPVSGA